MIRSIKLNSLTLFADDGSRPGLDILENGFNYEKHVVAELRKWIPTARGFLDLGANCGIHTIIAKTIKPEIPIVCAECSQFNIGLLLRNIHFNGFDDSVIVLPFAVADKRRVIQTNNHEPNMCVSLTGHPDSEDYPRLASAISLDMIELPPIDLIKIDIEGFEIHALNGASKILAHQPRIIFEFCPEISHRSGVSPEGFLQWFLDRDYKLVVLDYQPGMRAEFTDASKCISHVKATTKWIADILAEPIQP